MPARQLVLDLAARPALGRADFFVSPANALALAQVEAWPAWPQRRLAIAGPPAAGKTHLAHVWAAGSGATIVAASRLAGLDIGGLGRGAALAVEADGLAAADEPALFHLMNRLSELDGSLLLVAREPPARWCVALADLASRLRAVPVARLDPPDDALLAAVLVKLFADRQIAVAPGLVRYLVTRIDRSFAAAEAMVARLDAAGLAGHRPITVRLAGEVLDEGA